MFLLLLLLLLKSLLFEPQPPTAIKIYHLLGPLLRRPLPQTATVRQLPQVSIDSGDEQIAKWLKEQEALCTRLQEAEKNSEQSPGDEDAAIAAWEAEQRTKVVSEKDPTGQQLLHEQAEAAEISRWEREQEDAIDEEMVKLEADSSIGQYVHALETASNSDALNGVATTAGSGDAIVPRKPSPFKRRNGSPVKQRTASVRPISTLLSDVS